MCICASQCVSLLFHAVTLHWQSFRGGIRCNIQSLMCVENLWKLVFNGSGAVRTLPFELRVIHLVTRPSGPAYLSPLQAPLTLSTRPRLAKPLQSG